MQLVVHRYNSTQCNIIIAEWYRYVSAHVYIHKQLLISFISSCFVVFVTITTLFLSLLDTLHTQTVTNNYLVNADIIL